MTGVRLGLRENAAQFSLLVGVNALVGAMVGLERSVLPLVGNQDFGLTSTTAILAFVLAFGVAKACTNLVSGTLAEHWTRKRVLVIGWLVALPVPLLIGIAPTWGFVVAANILLGVNQGLAWSMTVIMKIDLAGPARRGLALGLNEAAGYLGVAATAFLTGALAATYAPRSVVWVGAALIAVCGLALSVVFVRDTGAWVALEQRLHPRAATGAPHGFKSAFAEGTIRNPVLRACSQAGLVNNLNDALAWGLAPLYLAAHGASVRQIAIVAAAYPVVWGAGQLLTGWASDHVGRKPLISGGMLVQAGALGLLVAGGGAFTPSLVAAIGLGVGDGDGLSHADRSRLRRRPAPRPGPDRQRLPLLARRRLRPGRADRRHRRRPALPRRRHPHRRSPDRRQRYRRAGDAMARAHRAAARPCPNVTKRTDIERTQITAIRRMASFHDRRVLEIGCGDGRFTRDIAREARSVHASDPDATEVAKAVAAHPAGLAGVTYDVAACADLDVDPCSIDLVFFSWSL
jgi:MFS family permease